MDWLGTPAPLLGQGRSGTEKRDGLDAYVYRVDLQDAPIEIADGVPGTYTDLKELYIDPRIAAIIHQTDEQQRFLGDGEPAPDLQLAFAVDQRAANIAEA